MYYYYGIWTYPLRRLSLDHIWREGGSGGETGGRWSTMYSFKPGAASSLPPHSWVLTPDVLTHIRTHSIAESTLEMRMKGGDLHIAHKTQDRRSSSAHARTICICIPHIPCIYICIYAISILRMWYVASGFEEWVHVHALHALVSSLQPENTTSI